MKHVSFCGLRLRALVVLTTCAAAALAIASPAMAISEAATPATSTFARNPPTTANWQDTLGIFGSAAPEDCGRVNDPNLQNPLFVCSVHDTDPQDDGTAEVVVDLTSMGLPTTPGIQVAVAVFKCLDPIETDVLGNPLPTQVDNATCDEQVAFADQAANPDLPQLRVTFPVIGNLSEPANATIFYEVRVIPLETGAETVNYTACAGYIDGGADPCVNDPRLEEQIPPQPQPVPADTFLTCTPGGNMGNRRFTGAVAIEDANGKKIEQVSASLRQRAERMDRPQGQINHRFFPTKRKFHSKKVACVAFFDATKTVEARGIGWVKMDGQKPMKVCFRFRGQDVSSNGTGDNFELETRPFVRNDPNTTADDTCDVPPETHGGTATKGDFRYRIEQRRQDDDHEYNEYDRDRTYERDDDYDWSRENG